MKNKSAPRAANDTEDRVRSVRLVRLANILQRGRPVGRKSLEDELEISRATLTRDIAILRDQLNMPIAFDRYAEGYILAKDSESLGPRYQLPGIWLSDKQAFAVLALTNIVMAFGSDLLRSTLQPLRMLVKQTIGLSTERPPPIGEKISIELSISENFTPATYRMVSTALYLDKQILLQLSGSNSVETRYSLLRFALTSEGWYLDALAEQDGIVFRFPVESIIAGKTLHRSATKLTMWDDQWTDTKGKVFPYVLLGHTR